MNFYLKPAFLAIFALIANSDRIHAQGGRIVPVFELYHSDNAFGGTSADRIFHLGAEVDTPEELRTKSDTILSTGAFWLNAVTTDLGGRPVTLSPFLRVRNFLKTGEQSTSFGAMVSVRFYEGQNDRVDLRTTVTRQNASWTSDNVEHLSIRLGYLRAIEGSSRIDIGLTSEWQSLIKESSVSHVGLSGKYRNSIGAFDVTGSARVNLRNSNVAGRSGRDVGLGLDVGRDLGFGRAYTKLSIDWSKDRNARFGQPTARSETTTQTEIGYAVPLTDSGLARFTAYVRQERSDANLAIYDATTNILGIGLRLSL